MLRMGRREEGWDAGLLSEGLGRVVLSYVYLQLYILYLSLSLYIYVII